jgi:zinc protease
VGTFHPDKNPDRATIPPPPDVQALVKDYKGQEALAQAESFDASPENIDKRTKRGTIPGGAKYAVLSKSTRGNTVKATLTLRIGSEASLQNKATLAQLTAGMLRRGTQNKSFQQLNDTLDKLKASVYFWGYGQTVNAGIETTKENLPAALKLVQEMLRQPAFPESEFKALQQEHLANIEQQKSDPQAIAFTTSTRLMNPYPKGHVHYTPTFDEQAEAINTARLDDVKQFYKDFYNSTGATVAFVGDFDESTTVTQLTDMLQNWSSPQAFARVPRKHHTVVAKTEKINTPDKKNAVYVAGLNLSLSDESPEYASLVMGNYILGGGFLNSRLATRIRQKEGISYGVGSYLDASSLDTTGIFGSYAIYNPENLEKLDNAYKEELAKLIKEGITAEELKAAKSGYLQNQQVQRADDGALARALNNNLYVNRTMAWEAAREKQIAELTVDKVNAALRKYITPDKIVYVEAGDFEKDKKTPQKTF